jgi:hypothetical protein
MTTRDMRYNSKVADNILPLSVEQTLPEAFKEWEVTGELIDHEHADEHCQLCDNEGLRYHFGIENHLTDGHLWVGSQCILRFGITMYEGLRELSASEIRTALKELVRRQRRVHCLKALERAMSADAAGKVTASLRDALSYFKRHECLTPGQASAVFERLRLGKIPHEPRWFKITTAGASQWLELARMPVENVDDIWFALSPDQRKFASRRGYTAPPELLGAGKWYTYREWLAAGWSDAQLRAEGLMR